MRIKAASTSVHKRETNAKTHVKHIMWTCRRTAFAFIHLCGVCSANRRMLTFWRRYFKEEYIHHHTDVDIHSFGEPMNNRWNTCLFACAANEQATFWHSLAFALVPHALFAFRCGRAFTWICALLKYSSIHFVRAVEMQPSRNEFKIKKLHFEKLPNLSYFKVDACNGTIPRLLKWFHVLET